jgi:hypothetical protein
MTEKTFDIGDAFDEIAETHTDDGIAPVIEDGQEESEAESKPEPEESTRDEKGRFKPKKVDPEPETLEEAASEPAAEEQKADETKPPSEYLPKAIKDSWAKLDPEIRDAIEQREREAHEKITRVDAERQIGRSFDATINEYKGVIAQEGGTPLSAVRDLLETAKVLRSSDPVQKAAMLNQIATRFGIDIEQAYYARPHPEVAELALKNQRYASQLAQYEAMQRGQEVESINDHIAKWAVDKPHFSAVSGEMTRLAQIGVSSDLTTLYDMAIAANEELRSASVDQAVKAKLAAEEANRAAQVQRARRAAISPSGASGIAKPPGSEKLTPEELTALEYDRIFLAHNQ